MCFFYVHTRTRSIYAVHRGLVHAWVGQIHPGELVAKVGYFGVKSAKVYRVQMGTKPC